MCEFGIVRVNTKMEVNYEQKRIDEKSQGGRRFNS